MMTAVDLRTTLPDRATIEGELGPITVFEQMGVPVIVTLTQGGARPRIVFVNDAGVRLLGFERGELVGQGYDFWQARDADDTDLEAITAALEAGRKVRMATVSRGKDGAERALRLEMIPRAGTNGLWVVSTVVWVSDEDPEDTGTIRIVPERRQLSIGNLVLDTATRKMRFDGQETELTPSESVLLGALIDQTGCVVDRTVLYEELWGFDSSLRSRAIDVYVGSLRRKLRELGAPDMIHTVRGVGYLISD